MAKKRIRKTAQRSVRKPAYKYSSQNKLSLVLIILALLVFALAAYTMSMQSNQVSTTNQVKITASPTPKPVVKATPVVKTLKK
jgi:flagellar basal body-associated protein FliL